MNEVYLNIESFYQKAKDLLSPDVFSFIDGGSLDGLALRRNRQSFIDTLLSPRVLRGVGHCSTQTTLFEQNIAAPVLIAPSAYQQFLSKQGELDMLEAANQFNTILIQSMFSSIDYSLIAKNKKVPVWLQMYLLKDRSINQRYLQLAHELGFDAIVLTVDTPVYAKKEREKANPLAFPDSMSWAHLKNIGIPVEECFNSKKHLSTLLDSAISWKDVEWLIKQTDLPIVLKGIIDPKDTAIALNYPHVKGIVISNHGGRQLDSCVPPLDVIQQHKQLVGNQIKLFLDGGIVRGSDIFKAIALGADATLIGRSALWALAVGSSQAVFQALSILQQELSETMLLCGCSSISDINSEYIRFKD